MMKHIIAGRQKGLSLLEMIVALAILGVSLGMLYQATGGAARVVQISEKYAYAVTLAESLFAEYSVVPGAGMEQKGKTDSGYSWSVIAVPIPEDPNLSLPPLMEIQIRVAWGETITREFVLQSVVAGEVLQ